MLRQPLSPLRPGVPEFRTGSPKRGANGSHLWGGGNLEGGNETPGARSHVVARAQRQLWGTSNTGRIGLGRGGALGGELVDWPRGAGGSTMLCTPFVMRYRIK